MLAFSSPPNPTSKLTANLLPCSIKHSGPIAMTSHHWNPTVHNDGTQTAYFRGRRLRGKAVILPKGYCGYVVEKTDAMVEQRRAGEGGGEPQEQEDAVETKAMELKAAFEEVVVWGHEAVPSEQAGDEYVRGVEEWIAFAHAMHSSDCSAESESGPQ